MANTLPNQPRMNNKGQGYGLSGMFDLKDEDQVKEYLRTLEIEYGFQCEHEHLVDGCHRLGDFLEAFRKQFEKSREIYERNCSSDSNCYGPSCFKAGNYNLIGRGGLKNIANAKIYFERGCTAGNAGSCYQAGLLLEKEQNHQTALQRFEKACHLKDGDSCFRASGFHIKGFPEIVKDMTKAFEIASIGCNLNHAQCCANLSRMYKLGDGVEKNLDKSNEFKNKALDIHNSWKLGVTELKIGE